MFGVNGWELIILIVAAVVVLGPEHLPTYAAKLAQGVRKLRVMSEGAKTQLKEQLGPQYYELNWRQYDPRQYDPRRIVRDALAEPLDYVAAPLRELRDDVSGMAQEVKSFGSVPGGVAGAATAGTAGVFGGAGQSLRAGELLGPRGHLTGPHPWPMAPGPWIPRFPPALGGSAAGRRVDRQRPEGVRPSERPARPRARVASPRAIARRATAAGCWG